MGLSKMLSSKSRLLSMSGRVHRMMPLWLFPAFLKTEECMQPSFTLVWMEKGSSNWLRRLPALSSGGTASWRYSLFKMVFRSVVGCVFTSPCISFWSGLSPSLIMLSLSQLFRPIRLLLYPFFFFWISRSPPLILWLSKETSEAGFYQSSWRA